jgi:hypothetical protein
MLKNMRSSGTVDGIETRQGLDDLGFESWQRGEVFYSSVPTRPVLQLIYLIGTEVLSRG